ncbi:hypothetical protein CRE_28413 [Caenorhabditis remanei]|uniref:Uncharacterized protein n=1 Tax=Caenorhabditis remanei TaxID=31234 RepID=E3LMA6_CAERE|nr:hypothetical protein CRE_28413 [Caenorhabditis remanei]
MSPYSSQSTFIPRFCSSLGKDIVFVRTKSGTYSKFTFDDSKNCFLSVICNDCHVVPTEYDLLPLYAAWSNRLERYVIFVKNLLNGQVEQYVYEMDYEGFQQVFQPELVFDSNRSPSSNEFFTVGGTEKDGVTIIKKDSKGSFRKEQLNWGTKQFEVIPPVPVRLLQTKKLEKEETMPVTIQIPIEKVREILVSAEKEKQDSLMLSRKRKTESHGAPNADLKKGIKGVKPEDLETPKVPSSAVVRESDIHVVGNKARLSKKDIVEIRRLAALMGNPTEPDSSDDADYSDSDDDVIKEDEQGFEIAESSC